jgi:Zn-dependent alcohol dehydrogenase
MLDELVSQRLSLGELADAFDRLRAGEVFRQVVFAPRGRRFP